MGERRPDIRASDADRDRVVDLLRDHAVAGRLATEELEERIDAAFEARTRGELSRLTADLPRRVSSRQREKAVAVAQAALRAHVRSYLMVMAMLVTIWALTGMGYFWPVWPAACWGAGLAFHAACTPRRRRAQPPRAIART